MTKPLSRKDLCSLYICDSDKKSIWKILNISNTLKTLGNPGPDSHYYNQNMDLFLSKSNGKPIESVKTLGRIAIIIIKTWTHFCGHNDRIFFDGCIRAHLNNC